MPSPHRRPCCGQAAADYVALVCLAAAVLAAAGAALGGHRPLAAAVVHAVRVAVCVVGGDVCREADARAAGLGPCVVRAERFERRWNAGALSLTGHQEHGYGIDRRSDGSVVVTAGHDRGGGPSLRVAARLGPFEASAGGDVVLGWRSGLAWELDGRDQLDRFLERAPAPHRLEHDADWRRRGLPAPTTRYVAGAAGARLDVEVQAGVVVPIVEAHGRAALGRRIGPDGVTWFLEVPEAGTRLLGGGLPGTSPAAAGPWAAEVDVDAAGRGRWLRLRGSGHARRAGEEVELTRTIDLRSASAAAALRDLLSPDRAAAGARALAAMGNLQRDVHRVRELPSAPDVELAAVVVGAGHEDARTRRRLVESTVTAPGGATVRRADCLGLR